MSYYEIELIKLRDELGVDLLPKYLEPNHQYRLLEAMIKDIPYTDDENYLKQEQKAWQEYSKGLEARLNAEK